MMLSRIKAEQARSRDPETIKSNTHPKGRAVDSSSIADRSHATMVVNPFERKSTKSALNRYYRYFSALINSQYRRKDVQASSHVLGTYHDSFLFGKVPLSVKVRAALRGGWIGHIWHFVEFFLAISSGVLYVYSTYNAHTKDNWVTLAQNWISVAFLADYVFRVYSESVRVHYIFSFWGLIDLLSALPIIYFFKSSIHNGQFLRLLQFLRIIRVISLMSKLGIVGSTVLQQILLLVTSTFGAVFLVAGIFQYVESYARPQNERFECAEGGCVNFWDAFYFIIVTISTVGYGEITPNTQVGQLVVICTIIAALTVLPIQIGKITYLASKRPYGGSVSEGKIIQSRYLILSGTISFQDLQTYLAEFFNPTHCEDMEIYPLRVTILGPYRPSFELKQLLSLYDGLVEFVEGSPIKQSDLQRICAKRATAFFLLADKEAKDRDGEDAAQIVKALAVHRFCNEGELRIIVEVLEPSTQSSAVWDQTDNRVEVICPTKYHYKMIARRLDVRACSCFVKGLYTFITNLFTSEIKLKHVDQNSFVAEYFRSFDNEVYPLIFPRACCGMLFEEVVEFVFENYNVVLFALDVDVIDPERQEKSRKVFLHPKGHIIDADDIGLIIGGDLHTAYAISKFDDRHMIHANKWRWQPNGLSTMEVELHKYRTGPVVDTSTHSERSADHHTSDADQSIEARMKSEICCRLSHLSDGSGRGMKENQHGGTTQDAAEGSGDSAVESGYGGVGVCNRLDTDEGTYPKGMSLEEATERLLAWPPLRPAHVQPHAAVLERRQDVILQHLQERTISIVAFTVPHVLVCCQSYWPQHLFYFVKELRRPDFANPPIVILHPDQPKANEWGRVGIFQEVYFLKGSPVFELDLMRAGVLQAEKVVVLGFHDTPAVDLAGSSLEDVSKSQRRIPSAQQSDVDNMVIAANVERMVGGEAEVLMVDVQHTLAFHYLQPKFEVSERSVKKVDFRRNPDALVHFGPPFMAGMAVSPILLGFLLRSSFYNRNTISLVDQFLEGGHTIQDGTLSYNNPRILEQIPAPTEYINKHYSELFIGLLRQRGVLALGLYRGRGTLEAPTPYVFTNPGMATVVGEGDLVYVIS